jgi:hypothetical protein
MKKTPSRPASPSRPLAPLTPNLYLLPNPKKPLFVENEAAPEPTPGDSNMPTIALASDKQMTHTWRGITVPTVEALCAELAVRREATERTNPDAFPWDPTAFTYSRPKVVITSLGVALDDDDNEVDTEEVAKAFPWDHTVWSLLEAAEQARALKGRVYVQQEVVTHFVDDGDDVDDEGCVALDEGFRVLCADFLPDDARAYIHGADAEA